LVAKRPFNPTTQSITYLVLDYICLVVLFFDTLRDEKLILNEDEVL